MTVCIGALSEETDTNRCKSVIVASDRMVTMGGIIEFEHQIPKITKLNDKTVALVAGDALRGARVTELLKANLPNSVAEIAQRAGEIYAQCRDNVLENLHFRPRGFSRQEFYLNLQNRLIQGLIANLDEIVRSFNLSVEMIIAGVDDAGAHLYTILNPGNDCTDFHQIGYCSIGSGALHSTQALIAYTHTPYSSLERTMISVYFAKKRAEVAPGVGRETDLMLITERGIQQLTQAQLDQLEQIYNDYTKPLSDEIIERVTNLNLINQDAQPPAQPQPPVAQ